jgi:hypothetical protein
MEAKTLCEHAISHSRVNNFHRQGTRGFWIGTTFETFGQAGEVKWAARIKPLALSADPVGTRDAVSSQPKWQRNRSAAQRIFERREMFLVRCQPRRSYLASDGYASG